MKIKDIYIPHWASCIRVCSRDGLEMTVPLERFEYFLDKYSDIEADVIRSAEQGAFAIRIDGDDLDRFIKIKTKGYYTVDDVLFLAEDETPVEIYNSRDGILFKGTKVELLERNVYLNTLIRNFLWLDEDDAVYYDDDWGLCIEV